MGSYSITDGILLRRDCGLAQDWGRYVLSGRQCFLQTAHNDFEHGNTRSPAYFMLKPVEQDIGFWVCPDSHLYLTYSADEKLKLAKNLKLEENVIKKKSSFVGHGYVQHAGVGWEGDAQLNCHTYVIPKGAGLKDAVAVAYGFSLGLTPKKFNENEAT